MNYKGYFLCVQKAVPVMAIPRRVRPGYWSDIVQINSKSGLAGSKKNFAYAGSKFGGSRPDPVLRPRLVDDGIKVNSISPVICSTAPVVRSANRAVRPVSERREGTRRSDD